MYAVKCFYVYISLCFFVGRWNIVFLILYGCMLCGWLVKLSWHRKKSYLCNIYIYNSLSLIIGFDVIFIRDEGLDQKRSYRGITVDLICLPCCQKSFLIEIRSRWNFSSLYPYRVPKVVQMLQHRELIELNITKNV